LLTGYAESEVMNHVTSSNMAYCVSKPWDSEELIELVKKSIAGK
jgi:hypothetical protein